MPVKYGTPFVFGIIEVYDAHTDIDPQYWFRIVWYSSYMHMASVESLEHKQERPEFIQEDPKSK